MQCPRAIGMTHLRHASLLKVVVLWLLAWSLWYYAVWIGAELKDTVVVSTGDWWPGFFITIAMCFIPSWDSGGGSRFGRAFARSYSGGMCSTSCFKTVVGGGFFIVGVIWGVGIAMIRFIAPLPNQKHALTALPGWLMLGHIILLVLSAYQVLEYTVTPDDPNFTINSLSAAAAAAVALPPQQQQQQHHHHQQDIQQSARASSSSSLGNVV